MPIAPQAIAANVSPNANGSSVGRGAEAASQPKAATATMPRTETSASAVNQPTRIVPRGMDRVASHPARPSARSRLSDQPAIAAPTTIAAATPIASRMRTVASGAGSSATAAPAPT